MVSAQFQFHVICCEVPELVWFSPIVKTIRTEVRFRLKKKFEELKKKFPSVIKQVLIKFLKAGLNSVRNREALEKLLNRVRESWGVKV